MIGIRGKKEGWRESSGCFVSMHFLPLHKFGEWDGFLSLEKERLSPAVTLNI